MRLTPREQLIKRLADAGYHCDQGGIYAAEGVYRREDVVRWEAFPSTASGLKMYFYSWDTITDCARHGIVIRQGFRDTETEREVRAVAPRTAPNREVCGPAPLSPTAEKPDAAGSVSTALMDAGNQPERKP